MPQPTAADRPTSTTGIPGMVPPITPPDFSSSRARYQIVGAVKPRCGSLANSVPPAADRPGAAAQAFDAPAKSRGLNGDSGSFAMFSAAKLRSSVGNRLANGGRAAIPLPGSSGRISRNRLSGSTSDSRARNTSDSRCDDSCNPISLMIASESAGCQKAISGENRKNSGAPRPMASRLTIPIQALTPLA